MIIDINEDNFESEVLGYNGYVILDFYGTWCMPCKMLSPILNKIENDNNNIKIAKVDIDENDALIRKFGITSVPTIIIYKNGEEVQKLVGLTSEEKILQYIK